MRTVARNGLNDQIEAGKIFEKNRGTAFTSVYFSMFCLRLARVSLAPVQPKPESVDSIDEITCASESLVAVCLTH